ncbi:hypothetical protein AB0M02_39875 [Actinoplanes sp. NPDC051861]|uniref:hypothetical protein n=1 Tax=Actinoplanes sp. NPDC051861 TaxID=3155170 RepID=UPI0034428028
MRDWSEKPSQRSCREFATRDVDRLWLTLILHARQLQKMIAALAAAIFCCACFLDLFTVRRRPTHRSLFVTVDTPTRSARQVRGPGLPSGVIVGVR